MVSGITKDAENANGPGRPLRIVIVEDEYLVACELELSLLAAGFEVCGIAVRADEAVACVLKEQPDLVIMDIRLLGSKDGVAAAIEIYNRSNIRSIFTTAHADDETRSRAEAARPLGWVAKPYAGGTLVRTIRQVRAAL